MSRQKSRDERQEHPREGARTEGPRKRGVERREDPPEESHEGPPMAAPHRWVEAGLVTSAQARAIERLIGVGEPPPEALAGLVDAGILTRSQAGAGARA